MNDADFQYRIYRFDRQLAPGATGTIRFRTQRRDRGFTANDDDTRLVANGSFLGSWEFAPVIGMDRGGLLHDREAAQIRPARRAAARRVAARKA